MCWGKAEYEFKAWKGQIAEEKTPEKEVPKVTWREPEKEYDEEEQREREEVFERV